MITLINLMTFYFINSSTVMLAYYLYERELTRKPKIKDLMIMYGRSQHGVFNEEDLIPPFYTCLIPLVQYITLAECIINLINMKKAERMMR